MNRKTKIIIYISAITIIILTLLGVTYGYFVTKVSGNENTKSIEVITGTSSVLYTDLSEEINVIIEPGSSVTKKFKVENTGNVEAIYSIFLIDVINEFVRTEDVRYTLYRVGNSVSFPEKYSGCVENPTNENNCKIVVNNVEFPKVVTAIAKNEKIVNPNNYYTYSLVMTYIYQDDINQNVDQGHTFSAKVSISGSPDIISLSTDSLAYNVIENVRFQKNGTKLGMTETKVLSEISKPDERVLATAEDDEGPTYYFRGSVQDNYVEFKGMCFRIVRIEGDGAIKLIYAGSGKCTSTTTNSGNIGLAFYGYREIENSLDPSWSGLYLADYKGYTGSAGLRNKLQTWLNNNFTSSEKTKYLKNDKWCLGGSEDYKYDTYGVLIPQGGKYESSLWYGYKVNNHDYHSWYYASGKRLNGIGTTPYATLKCSSEEEYDENYVGTLTVDEIVFAGGGYQKNESYYLYEQMQNTDWFTLSLRGFDGFDFSYAADLVIIVSSYGNLNSDYVDFIDNNTVRPSITLVSGITIKNGGEGTKTNPYVIE